jgi:hypothetical protein
MTLTAFMVGVGVIIAVGIVGAGVVAVVGCFDIGPVSSAFVVYARLVVAHYFAAFLMVVPLLVVVRSAVGAVSVAAAVV